MEDMSKVVVVTGAASGIGEAVAKKYLKNGCQVIGIDRKAQEAGFEVKICDIGEEDSVKVVFQDIGNSCKRIDYLVNAAGVFYVGERSLVAEMNMDNWNATIQNNLTGTMLCCKYAIPLMLRGEREDCGIVNITSDQACFPRKKNAAYAISKSGMNCFTKVLAGEVMEHKIRVNAIAPASVRTHFIDGLETEKRTAADMYKKEEEKMPLGLIMPEDVAELAYFLGSSLAKRITGQIIMMDSGLYSIT